MALRNYAQLSSEAELTGGHMQNVGESAESAWKEERIASEIIASERMGDYTEGYEWRGDEETIGDERPDVKETRNGWYFCDAVMSQGKVCLDYCDAEHVRLGSRRTWCFDE